LCPRAYLRVPDHGDPHLLPCCGYLPWRSRGLNTDSWRPPWGHRHDHQANSKDQIQINLLGANGFQFAEFEVLHVNSLYPREAREPSGNRANSFFCLGSQVVGLEIKMDTSLSKSESKWSSPADFKDLCYIHTQDVHEYNYTVRRDYSSPGRTGSTSASPCAASTRLPAAAALHRLRRTPPRHRLLGVRLPRLLTSTSLNQKTSRGRLSRHQQLVRIHLQLVDFTSNRRVSIIDSHDFVDSCPRIKLSHLFQ
jgi:hypothetical protein